MRFGGFGAALAGAYVALMSAPGLAAGFDAGHAPFAIEIGGRTIPYATFFTVAQPGETLTLALAEGAPDGAYQVITPEGEAVAMVEGAARWTAPDAPGQTRTLDIARAEGGAITLNVFIEQPASAMDSEGRLRGYQIGSYPSEPLRGLEVYQTPTGFIEVTEDNRDMKVSPHFTLGQFLCKQQQDQWPKYVLLDEMLLLKMEALLQDVNAQGIATDSFVVMSGYRTPWYNRAIGNTTTYSQHVFGGAADIYVDIDGDGEMDDLNGDGRVTVADAQWLAERAALLEGAQPEMVGGVGVYDRNSVRGPFVHVDTRGFEARW